jgi:hypothetical protein
MSTFRLSMGLPRLLRDTVLFLIILLGLHLGVRFAHQHYVFDGPRWWPLSIFNPRSPTPTDILIAVVVLAGFLAALWRLERTQYRSATEAAVFGTLLILGSNAIQGTVNGFIRPTAGGTIQYYHDAQHHTESPLVFLRDYPQIQPTMGDHGRTHPPGAVLLFRTLIRLTGDNPALVSILIAVVAALLSALFFRLLLSTILPDVPQNQGVFLLLLMSAVQIYYCATLDAIIASLLLGAVALFALPPTTWRIVGATVCLIVASFLTFGFVWVVPLLLMVEINRWQGQQSVLRLIGLFTGAFAFYTVLYICCGFDYVLALRTATHLENPAGFRLLSEPLSYFFTRLEDIAEIAVFTGPVLISILFQSIKRFCVEHVFGYRLFLAALGTLFLLFLTGAYRTGETARACLFIFPYLLLPVLINDVLLTSRRRLLFGAVFGQAVLMQAIGRYFW